MIHQDPIFLWDLLPQSLPGFPRLTLKLSELIQVFERVFLVGMSVALADQLGVEEGVVGEIDKGQEAAVTIPPLPVVLSSLTFLPSTIF